MGRAVVDLYHEAGADVTGTSRREGADEVVADAADLDRLLAREHFDQVVLTAPLTAPAVDWLVDRVDGSRWVVLSSAQLSSRVPSPGTQFALAREETALVRGATVFRPTMIFGRGADANVSRIVRLQQRWRIAVQVGDGSELVQPVHVADLVALLRRHLSAPKPGLFSVGGDERIPTRELVEMVKELTAVRLPVVVLPRALVRAAARTGVPGLRRDQLLRLEEDKTVDITGTCDAFAWRPEPLAQRVQQAVCEVINRP
ncbi:MAG: hypothetical protein M3326_08385 [Actinomycetota bacterium]|nr:hypothetical protein [Actinomycetota bacterium]